MSVAFTQIPAALLVPGQYQEIDNSLAGAQGDIKKVLIVGYRVAGSPAPAGVPVQVLTWRKAAELCGYGSDVAVMAKAFLELNTVEECWLLPLDEPEVGVRWSRSFTVAAVSAAAGSVGIKINGTELAAAVAKGDSAENIAAAIVAAVNSQENLPVEAAASGGVVTLTALVRGYVSDRIKASMASDAAGVSVSAGEVTHGSGGDYSINISELCPALENTRYNYIISEFDAPAHLRNLADELASRYTATRQIGGRAFVALRGEVGSVSTPGSILSQAEAVNSPHIVLVPALENDQLPCEWAARFCAVLCRLLADDPASNTYDTPVPGLTAAAMPDAAVRQKLLEAGVMTWRLDTTGSVLAERPVTSYTENSDGGRDTSYLDIQVVETVDAVRTYINAEAKKRFKTWKLASTEENFGSGAKVMTPGVFRSFLSELYGEIFIKEKQWCQDAEGYQKSLSVEIKSGSKTRLEYIHQPNLIGQFYIGTGLTQFK